MKKIFCFLFLHVACLACICAQESLLDTTKMWSHLSITPSWGGPPPHAFATDFHKVSGLVTIDSVSYYKLMISTDQSQTNWSLQAYVRENGNGKVYYRGLQDTADLLIYDFGLEVGDAVVLREQAFNPLYVNSIDSVWINNEKRKRINFLPPEAWVEGIGSMFGLLQSGYGGLVGANHYLLCYFENDVLMYADTNFSLCYYNTVGLREPVSQDLSITIYPNPVISISTLTIDAELDFSGALLEVYAVNGVRVRSYPVRSKGIPIPASDFCPGIYFYRLITPEWKGAYGKFVVK
jgi:hypothetical protein